VSAQVPDYTWEALGPFEVANHSSDTGQWTANGIGWVESLGVAGRKERKIYAGSNVGGLFYSKNYGETWDFRFNLDRVCGVWDIVLDKTWARRLWVATGTNTWDYDWGHGVLYSGNGGKTWKPTGLHFEPNQKEVVYCLERSSINKNLFVACTATDIYVSRDRTRTWKNVLDQDKKARVTFRHLELHNQDINKMVASGAQLWFTEDGGNNWSEKSSEMTFQKVNNKRDSLPPRYAIAINPQNNDQVVVLYTYRRKNYIDRSDDFGRTWYNVYAGRDFDRVDLNHAEICWHPTDSNRMTVAGVRVYQSDNQGQSFSLVSNPSWGHMQFMHDDIRAMHYSPRGNLWVGHDGGVSVSRDTCKTWKDVSGYGLQATQFYDIAVDNGRIVGGCQDLSSMFYVDGKWSQTSSIYGDGGMNLIKDNEVYIMQNGMRVHKGEFGMDKWRKIFTPFTPKRFKYPFVYSPTNGNALWLTDHDIWQYENKDWKNLTKKVPHAYTKIVALDINDPDSNVVYFAKDQPTWDASTSGLKHKLYRGLRTTLGYNWTDITSNLPILAWREITSIVTNPVNVNEVYVSLYGFDEGDSRHCVYRSMDGGETWKNYSDGLPNLNALKIVLHEKGKTQLLATDEGVFYRNSDLNKWVKLNDGMWSSHVIDLEYDAGTNAFYAATFGNGVWKLVLGD
jgi:photosystem II stability/assembly factor-like uncharacterized protein